MPHAAGLFLCLSVGGKDRDERKRFCDWPIAGGESRDGPRDRFWRERRGILSRLFRDWLRSTHRGERSHRAVSAEPQEAIAVIVIPVSSWLTLQIPPVKSGRRFSSRFNGLSPA